MGMKRIRSVSRLGIIAILAVAALPCFATEVAVLKNGFSIRHERRETVGDVTRLYVNADGSSFVDVPTAQLDHFEAAPELPASLRKLLSADLAFRLRRRAFRGRGPVPRLWQGLRAGRIRQRLCSPRCASREHHRSREGCERTISA